LYKSSITELLELIPRNLTRNERNFRYFLRAAGDKVFKVQEELGKMLKELGWPEQYIIDKVIHDISHALAIR